MDPHRWSPRRAPDRFVLPAKLDASGRTGPTRGQARGPKWRATGGGFYVPAHVPPDTPEQRIAEAAPLLPSGGAVTGWAAMRLHQVGFADGVDRHGRCRPVPLLVGPHHGRRSRPGVRWMQGAAPDLVQLRHGIPCAPLQRAVFDEMRFQKDVREAVVALDMAAATGLVTLEEMAAHVDSHPTWLGVGTARAALALGSHASASPQETRLRLVWVLDARWPPPLVNVPVFDRAGRLLGYPDLLDVESGLVVEYDGADHRDARRHSSDVDREARMRAAGLEVTRITGLDIRQPERALARMREARSRAQFLPPSHRGWVL